MQWHIIIFFLFLFQCRMNYRTFRVFRQVTMTENCREAWCQNIEKTIARAVAYLECGKGGQRVWGTEVPSGVQGQSPGRGSGGQSPPEADAYLSMNAQILTFWRNKLVKQSGFRHYTVRKKLWSGQRGGGIAQCPPPKYATALECLMFKLSYQHLCQVSFAN